MFQVGDIIRPIPGKEVSSVDPKFDLVPGMLYTISEVVYFLSSSRPSIRLAEKPGNPPPDHGMNRFELVERKKKMKTKWTKELIVAEAQKYQKRSMFARYSNNAYYAAVRMGILDEVCDHMPQRSLAKKYGSDKKVFVRYQNRKLYDVSASKYVNLGAILAMPLGSFTVIDDKTKDDITNFILIQGVTAAFHENPESFEAIKGVLIEKNILKGSESEPMPSEVAESIVRSPMSDAYVEGMGHD